jgi:5-methylcytosine-specific restriction endonuclease McrA
MQTKEERRELARLRSAKNRAKDIQKARAREAKWRKEHPASRRAKKIRRRAMKMKAPGAGVSAAQWIAILANSPRCEYCGSRDNLTMDHVIPLCRGGAHDILNIVPACHSCNSKKGSKLLSEWKSR